MLKCLYNLDSGQGHHPLPVNNFGIFACGMAWPRDFDPTTCGLPGTGTVLHVHTNVDRPQVGIGRVAALEPLRLHLEHIPDTLSLQEGGK